DGQRVRARGHEKRRLLSEDAEPVTRVVGKHGLLVVTLEYLPAGTIELCRTHAGAKEPFDRAQGLDDQDVQALGPGRRSADRERTGRVSGVVAPAGEEIDEDGVALRGHGPAGLRIEVVTVRA